MNSALACGVAPLAFVIGMLILRGPRVGGVVRMQVDRTVLATALGVAALSPVLVLLAHMALFAPRVIGAVGWVAVATWIAINRRARWRWRWRVPDALVLLAAIVFATVAVNGRDEPWGAGRDQQVYAEFAVLIADTGGATIRTQAQDDADAELLRALGTGREIDRYLGVTRVARAGAIEERSYFPLGWPVWLAFAYAVGGFPALHAANALVFPLGAMLLYPVLRRPVGAILACASVVTLLALPASLWIAGVALSEPLAMMMWLAMMALLALGGSRGRRWVPALVFAAATVRIDVLVLAPALIGARFVQDSMHASPAARRSAIRFAMSMLVCVAAALAWYASLQRPYLSDNLLSVAAVVAASFLAAGAAAGGVSWYRVAQRVLSRRAVAHALAAIVIMLALYAILLRPGLSPFAVFHNGTGLDGTRDYREESLRNLAVYAGWPILLLAIAGAAVAALRMLRPIPFAERAALMTGLAFCALYVWAPLISPDHPWAIRRFVPVALPAIVMLAALALRALVRRRAGRAAAAGVLMIGAACEAAAAAGTPMLTLRDNRGAGALIAAIDASMPNALVVADMPAANAGIVLSVARQRRVLVADLQAPAARVAVAQWFSDKAGEGKPAWMLHGPELSTAGLLATPVGQWAFERRTLMRTTRPPARTIVVEPVRLVLSRVAGLNPEIAFEGFGAKPTWGIPDEGFHASEVTAVGGLRMTNGAASVAIPVPLLRDATGLRFDWFSWAPRGESRETQVRLDGRPAWRGTLPPGVTSIVVPLPPALPPGSLRIEIHSAAFDTRTLDPSDRRGNMGVGLLGIHALRGPPFAAGPQARAALPGVESTVERAAPR